MERFPDIRQWEAARSAALRGTKKKERRSIEKRFQRCRPKWNHITREYV